MKYKKILFYRTDTGIMEIRLNAPPENIIDRDMLKELKTAVDHVIDQGKCKVMVFSGAGDNFTYGASRPDCLEHAPAEEMASNWYWIFKELIRSAIPTMAVVRGQCRGWGLELAAMCNFVFADTGAQFAMPDISQGIIPLYAPLILPWRVGQGLTDYLTLTGKPISAADAKLTGLVEYLSRPEDLEEKVRAFIENNILPRSGQDLRYVCKATRWYANLSFTNNCTKVRYEYLKGLPK
ncbi:enoyl-CoA hydratase/isomerase family protein [Planctomycetota bacterium]